MMLLRFDTVARTDDFDEHASAMHLRPWQWRFLLAVDGSATLGDLATTSGIDFETAAEFVTQTEELGLVRVVTQTLDEYRKALGGHATTVRFDDLTPVASPRTVEVIAASALTTVSFGSPMSFESEPAMTTVASHVPDVFATALASPDPAKKVSVSFDSLATMFDDHAVSHAFAEAPFRASSLDRASIDEPLDDVPFAFETPDHMTRLDDRAAAFEPRAAVDEAPPTAPTKNVSFSLFAPTFGAVGVAAASDAFAPLEPHTNGSVVEHESYEDRVFEASTMHHADVDEEVAHEASSYQSRESFAEHLAPDESHVTEGATSSVAEPSLLAHDSAFEAPATHESTERVAHAMTHDVVEVADVAPPEPVKVAPAVDGVLMQHFNVPASPPQRSAEPESSDAEKPGGDLTGSLLRALGLKK
ncbi:MAG: hypothetical protein NVS1B2_12440 [Vulcanimicrobiaceae bacterium]